MVVGRLTTTEAHHNALNPDLENLTLTSCRESDQAQTSLELIKSKSVGKPKVIYQFYIWMYINPCQFGFAQIEGLKHKKLLRSVNCESMFINSSEKYLNRSESS